MTFDDWLFSTPGLCPEGLKWFHLCKEEGVSFRELYDDPPPCYYDEMDRWDEDFAKEEAKDHVGYALQELFKGTPKHSVDLSWTKYKVLYSWEDVVARCAELGIEGVEDE